MPHVVHGDAADACLGAACLETPVQVPGLEWRTGPGREYQPALGPGGVCRCLRGGLVLLPDAQCRHADTRKREGGLRRLGLGFPVEQLATNPLELPADIQFTADQGRPTTSPLRRPITRISTYAA
jgi:hypothetical protein